MHFLEVGVEVVYKKSAHDCPVGSRCIDIALVPALMVIFAILKSWFGSDAVRIPDTVLPWWTLSYAPDVGVVVAVSRNA